MSSLGKEFRITVFGASHGEAVGVVMEGLPVGFAIDMGAHYGKNAAAYQQACLRMEAVGQGE